MIVLLFRVFLSFIHPLNGGKSETSMVRDHPDGQKKHGKGGNGVDNEHEGKAGELDHHGVEAGVDPAAEHCNGQAEAASKGPGEKRMTKREEKLSTWRCLETSHCL